MSERVPPGWGGGGGTAYAWVLKLRAQRHKPLCLLECKTRISCRMRTVEGSTQTRIGAIVTVTKISKAACISQARL